MNLAKTAAKKHRVPKALEHRAQAIMRKGHDEQSAYAIATAASQREGRLRKGTHKLTRKGKGWEAKHEKEAGGRARALTAAALFAATPTAAHGQDLHPQFAKFLQSRGVTSTTPHKIELSNFPRKGGKIDVSKFRPSQYKGKTFKFTDSRGK